MKTSSKQPVAAATAAGILLALGISTINANDIVLTPNAVNKIYFNNFENVFRCREWIPP